MSQEVIDKLTMDFEIAQQTCNEFLNAIYQLKVINYKLTKQIALLEQSKSLS